MQLTPPSGNMAGDDNDDQLTPSQTIKITDKENYCAIDKNRYQKSIITPSFPI